MNNYMVRSYRDVIVVTKIATRRSSKAQFMDPTIPLPQGDSQLSQF